MEIKPCFGTVNFERRKHPRFSIDLPVEYWQIHNRGQPTCTFDTSQGGLMFFLPEEIEVGQNLGIKLFIGPGLELKPIAAAVQVVWKDLHLGKTGDYRMGVKFVDISSEDLGGLKNFLRTLKKEETHSEMNLPPKLLASLGISIYGKLADVTAAATDQD
ncbi:MAG: PilZ domain-containing protein [Deltaproteobacteria bacterium]|nr:PilZ domain-containing protein [Deltaproteobacteria bacterium]